jgi:hypothetical protein
MDISPEHALHRQAVLFLTYLIDELTAAGSALEAARTSYRVAPTDVARFSAFARAVSLHTLAGNQVAAQRESVAALAVAISPASAGTPLRPPTPLKRLPDRLSDEPSPTRPRTALERLPRVIAAPDEGWVDRYGCAHRAHIAEARTLSDALGRAWTLADGVSAIAEACAASLPAADDAAGEDGTPPASLRDRVLELTAQLEAPCFALVEGVLVEGATLLVRHVHGDAVANAFAAPPPPCVLDPASAQRLAQILKARRHRGAADQEW